MVHNNYLRFILLTLLVSVSSHVNAGKTQERFSIMGLGDSITEGSQEFSSYLYSLWEELFSKGYDFDFIGPRKSECRIGELHHCGFSGHTVEFLNEHIDSIYHLYPADIVLLHAGHNHFSAEKPVSGMIKAYKSIIAKLHHIKPGATVFLAMVTPSGKLPKYSYIPELNRAIKKLVSSYHSSKVVLVDMATGHDYRTMTIADRVHPNKLGRERMAHIWATAIEKRFKAQHPAFRPESICYKTVGADSLSLYVFKAKGRKPHPTVVYYFAGGWKYGSPLQFFRECAWNAAHGITSISVDYRIGYLYGTQAEDAVEDGIDAIDYIRGNAKKLGVDPSRIIAAGASAGAVIAGKIPDDRLKARILYYPVVDSLQSEVSQIHRPVLFMIGTRDSFTPIDKTKAFLLRLCENNTYCDYHIFEGLPHPLFRYREPLDAVYYRIRSLTDDFLGKMFSSQ